MLDIFKTRWSHGRRTAAWPATPPTLPDRFRGALRLHPDQCETGCVACAQVCPTDAVQTQPALSLDLGRCTFCGDCVAACPTDALTQSQDYQLASTTRQGLVLNGPAHAHAQAISDEIVARFGHSLGIRVVSAGGCGGCAAEINALSNVIFDLGRFGVHVVASPRHADALIVTGAVSQHMSAAVLATWRAIPAPKFALAVGACAISGGPFAGLPQVNDGVGDLLPVDLFIPGCPPHPYTLLDGILRAVGIISGT